jgi:glycosyltransferase involved in cell wall biosynthesis
MQGEMYMNGIEVSVIITSYNKADTMPRCIQSVLAQTLKNIEIIIIDDASTDNSAQIAIGYAQKYQRIKFLQNAHNLGPGATKNKGIEVAQGDYIGFVDADDYVDKLFYKKLYRAATASNACVACGDLCVVYSNKEFMIDLVNESVYYQMNRNISHGMIHTQSTISGQIVAGFWGGASSCTKLIRRESYQQFPFFEGRSCDDLASVLPICASSLVVLVDNAVYYYVQTENSVERGSNIENRMDALRSVALVLGRYRAIHADPSFSQMLVAHSFLSVLNQLLSDPKNAKLPHLCYDICHILEELNSCKEMSLLLDTGENIYLNYVLSLLPTEDANNSRNNIQLIKEYFSIKEQKPCNKPIIPLVSIIIPVYNGTNYLKDALESALHQTYPNIEVIVVNDGSKDAGRTELIAMSYGERVRYYFKKNGGVATALNLGIEKMNGEYFSWLSHDDMYMPTKVANEIEALTGVKDKTTIIVEGYQVIDSTSKSLYPVNLNTLYPKSKLHDGLFALLRGGVNGCCMLIHKSHFMRVGGFDPALPTTQDYDLFFKMLRDQKIVYLETCNVLSRAHEAQESKAHIESHILECDRLWIGMMQKLTDAERLRLDGSVYGFYTNLYNFLHGATGYTGAIRYANRMMLISGAEEYERNKTDDYIEKLNKQSNINEQSLLRLLAIRKNSMDDKPLLAMIGLSRKPHGEPDIMQMELMKCLSEKYRFVYLYFLAEENSSKEYSGIYDGCQITFLSDIIIVLAILNVDAIILSYNCDPNYLRLYPELKAMGIKSIAWNHEDYFLPILRDELHSCLAKRIRCLASANFCVWINAKSYSTYRLQNSNGAYLQDFVPTFPARRPNYTDGIRERRILAIGRFDDELKGLEPLLRTFAIINQCSNARLKVVGSYCLDNHLPSDNHMTYQQLIDKLDLAERLDFLPWQSETENLYTESRVHVLLSTYEGFGLTVVEAAACGTPTVAFDGSGMADIITDGVDGYLVPIYDVDTAAKKILLLLENETQWAKMSKNAYAMAERYSKKRIIPKWENLIDNLLRLSPEAFEKFLAENYTIDYDLSALARIMPLEYENCINRLLSIPVSQSQDISVLPNVNTVVSMPISQFQSAPVLLNVNTLSLVGSRSWQITKPIRAFQNARKNYRGVKKQCYYFFKYLRNPAMDNQTDAEILRSNCWRITAPLRNLARPFKKNR